MVSRSPKRIEVMSSVNGRAEGRVKSAEPGCWLPPKLRQNGRPGKRGFLKWENPNFQSSSNDASAIVTSNKADRFGVIVFKARATNAMSLSTPRP